jgi:hypothetical protein
MEPTRAELDPATIEAIAGRVAELLDERNPARASLVDAADLARVLGVERDWVYRHAARLGAIRLGDRPGARLRFDVDAVLAGLPRLGEAPDPASPTRRPSRRRRRRLPPLADVELLPLPVPGLPVPTRKPR